MNTLELEIARRRKGKTRRDMASAIGKCLNAYAKKETGKTPFTDEEKLALAAELEQKQVTVKIKAGEGGRAFGSVSSKEIAAACKEQHNIEIDKKKIQLAENLKNFGAYEVGIKLHPQVTAKLTVKVAES